jgi:glycosyltransferase involved in cell wall biosynthesis
MELAGKLSKGATNTYFLLNALDDHARRCAAEINRANVDVALVASSMTTAASPLGRYLEVPSVLYLQEPMRHLYEAQPRLPWPALPSAGGHPREWVERARGSLYLRSQRVMAREELLNVKGYDRVLANSYFSRESMIRAYGTDPKVCYLGVDTDRYFDKGLEREATVVGIGEFNPRKRQHAVIEAVARLPRPRPTLVWIGNAVERRYFDSLTELATSLGVPYKPMVSIGHDAVVEILNRARVLAYAPRLEPFGYAPLEAGACGVPVVARAEGGVRESVIDGRTGFLVDDDEDLAPALAKIFDDRPLAEEMRRTARRVTEEKWSLPAAGRRLESHLLAVASGH